MNTTHKGKVRVEFTPDEAKALLYACWDKLKDKLQVDNPDHTLVVAFVKLGRGVKRLNS